MKTTDFLKQMTVVIFCAAVSSGCSYFSDKYGASAKKTATAAKTATASPEATQAIAAAKAAIGKAKANDWIWRDTEKFLKQAEEAAGKGDNATAIKLAKKAKGQADAAVSQYQQEMAKFSGK